MKGDTKMPYITLENGKKVRISKESYEALAKAIKEEDREIFVPDDVKIVLLDEDDWFGDGLGIVFNDEKQILLYDVENGIWRVWGVSDGEFVECKLIPVKKDDLKVGYTYFRTNGEHPDFSELSCYCKYLGDGSYAYVESDDSVLVSDFGYLKSKKWNK